MGTFRSYQELAQSTQEGKDFIIELRQGESGIAVMAPHGGEIESGTAAIADAIAGSNHGYYAFKGIRAENNWQLHIPSIFFDEPQAMGMIRRCHTIITIHGCRGGGRFIYLGGRDSALKKRIATNLIQSGYKAEIPSNISLRGEHPNNLCNRGKRGKGLQLEISESLRRFLTKRGSMPRHRLTHQLQTFAATIRHGIMSTRKPGWRSDPFS